jgi:hypothetical protein
MKKTHFKISISLLIFFIASAVSLAGPVYSFERITNNSSATIGIGEAQLAVEVIDSGIGEVTFFFTNSGPEASSITDIYFDNGLLESSILQSILSIDNSSAGVDFSQGANPGNLPAHNNVSPSFDTTSGLSADSNAPRQPKGVNPGEYVGLTLSLAETSAYGDVLDDLATGALRIGLHVQGFADGASESYINNGPQVPAPGSILLASMGIGLVRFMRKRKMVPAQ